MLITIGAGLPTGWSRCGSTSHLNPCPDRLSLSQEPLSSGETAQACDFLGDFLEIPVDPLPRTRVGTGRNQVSGNCGRHSSEDVVPANHETAVDRENRGAGLGVANP